jgi:hypothetical protein
MAAMPRRGYSTSAISRSERDDCATTANAGQAEGEIILGIVARRQQRLDPGIEEGEELQTRKTVVLIGAVTITPVRK